MTLHDGSQFVTVIQEQTLQEYSPLIFFLSQPPGTFEFVQSFCQVSIFFSLFHLLNGSFCLFIFNPYKFLNSVSFENCNSDFWRAKL